MLVAGSVTGQVKPAFDIADVHASAPATNPFSFVSGGLLRAGRYDLRKATMLDLIRIGWGVDANKIVGGPSWLDFDRYDISAKAPAATPPDTVRLMLQSLLADRFKLTLHNDTRPMPAFALTASKGPLKWKASESSSDGACQSVPQAGAVAPVMYSCRNMSTAALAIWLRRVASDYLSEVVVDLTGIEGSWDFDLKWHPRSRILLAGTDRITIVDALEKQLGLTLAIQDVPVPVIVVDRANEQPSANPPGVAQSLPPRSLKFEVATLKPSAPDGKLSYKLSPSGQVEFHAFVMRDLISEAWDIDWNHMDERIANAPKWIDSRRFDIVAKTSPATDAPRGTGFMDDDLRLMLRALLIERFGIASHYEERPVSGYALMSLRPKLTRADPANRTGCKPAGVVADDPRDKNPARSKLVQCKNITMVQFAQQLQSMDPGEFPNNGVVDTTGLKGAWDFMLNFSPRSLVRSGVQASDGAAMPSDPNGALSFTDAIRQQLGLKLEMRKRPMPVLVIDHIDETPAEN